VTDGQTVGQTESIMAKTALCVASYMYADALSTTRRIRMLRQYALFNGTVMYLIYPGKLWRLD